MREPSEKSSVRRVTKRRDAALLSRASVRASIVLATALLLPVALIPVQDIPTLEHFHNRKLQAWPDISSLPRKPPTYFNAARTWIADRVFPIIELSTISRKAMLFLFDSAPQKRITMGADGYVFLNGSSDSDVFGIFKNVCVRAHTSQAATELRTALEGLSKHSRTHGLPIDVVVVPTMASIYGGLLPRSVPIDLRNECGARARGESNLLALDDDPALSFKYPLREMNRVRDDEAFFPKANWHPSGLSLAVARDAYLKKMGLPNAVGDELLRTTAASELFAAYGIERQYPVYAVVNSNVVETPLVNERLHSAVADLFDVPRVVTHAYETARAASSETVLMLSDSYGDYSSGVFSSEFARLLHITTNDMKEERLPMLLDRVERITHIDRVILLVMEGNYDRVVRWSKALQSSGTTSDTNSFATEIKASRESWNPLPCDGAIDALNGTSPVPMTLPVGTAVSLHGWTAISVKEAELAKNVYVALLIDNQIAFVRTHRNPRPDLASYFGRDALAQSGFASTFTMPKTNSPVSIAIARTDNNGVLSMCAPARTLIIDPAIQAAPNGH